MDDGAGLRGVGRQERRRAGLLHGLLQDPRDAQAEQAGALQGQPRRRRRHPPGAAAAGKGAGGGGGAAARQVVRRRRGRRRPPPPAARRLLPHGKKEVSQLFPVLYQSLKNSNPEEFRCGAYSFLGFWAVVKFA